MLSVATQILHNLFSNNDLGAPSLREHPVFSAFLKLFRREGSDNRKYVCRSQAWGRRTTAFHRKSTGPEDDSCESLGGGQTECILHGALLC